MHRAAAEAEEEAAVAVVEAEDVVEEVVSLSEVLDPITNER